MFRRNNQLEHEMIFRWNPHFTIPPASCLLSLVSTQSMRWTSSSSSSLSLDEDDYQCNHFVMWKLYKISDQKDDDSDDETISGVSNHWLWAVCLDKPWWIHLAWVIITMMTRTNDHDDHYDHDNHDDPDDPDEKCRYLSVQTNLKCFTLVMMRVGVASSNCHNCENLSQRRRRRKVYSKSI